jgi:hypothetical protein
VAISFVLPFLLGNAGNKTGGAVFIWFLNGSPVFVSYCVAREIKFEIPAVILLVSAIAYGLLYVLGVYDCISCLTELPGYYGLFFACLGILTFPVALPTWIIVLRLNSHYIRKAEYVEWRQRLFDEVPLENS